jgi:YfiH family protein
MTLPVVRPDWPAPPQVCALVTTRDGGVSAGPFRSMNLADHVGDDPEAVATNRARLMAALHLSEHPLWMQQVHGASVVRADTSEHRDRIPTADAAVAFGPARPCVVLTADCLPVLLCDRGGRTVAAAHAGWRGLAAGVLQATVAAMDVEPANLLAWFGPAIGAEAFEVGSEVRERFLAVNPACAAAFAANERGRWQADLYELARIALRSAGVHAIHGGDHCTHRQADAFFSYRRDGRTGRMAALIWVAPPGRAHAAG